MTFVINIFSNRALIFYSNDLKKYDQKASIDFFSILIFIHPMKLHVFKKRTKATAYRKEK